ncbi:hypothetical protein DB345_05450 [Spartobacteria bacterium LR76]|nr:hypothetical protein DB345_05450 [Spartobacteria bacterium LR76]
MLNLLGYFLFVVVSYGVVVSHACLLKCTPVETVLEIFSKLLLPLGIFRSRTIKEVLGRMVFYWLIGCALFLAYELWLHSDLFPRAWLDQESLRWKEGLLRKLRENAAAFPSMNR